jgi:pimeloyl-ACP methyl ester carboxylesterase
VVTRHKTSAWSATVTVEESGLADAAPLLLLHGEEGPGAAAGLARRLAGRWRVIAPRHPGFDGEARVPGVDRPVDLAYLYLDLLDRLGISECAVVGTSLGAWIGLEMAAMHPSRFSALAVIGPIGVKFGDRLESTFAEVLVAAPDAIRSTLYHDAVLDPWDSRTEPEDKLARAQQREAFLHYSWEPYLFEPRLLPLLPRIDIPVLVVNGANDGLADPQYYATLAKTLPDARLDTVADAGHFPEIEQLDETAGRLEEFLGQQAR